MVSLAIYARSTAPSVLNGDSAELQTVALTAGVAHTTGYPTFALIGWLFGHTLPGDPAFRINIMSSVFGAASLAMLVVVGVEMGLAAPVAFAGAIVFGAGCTFWSAALRAEVYTVSIFIFLIAWWRTLVALRTNEIRDRLVAAALLGLSATGELSCAPALAVLGLTLAWVAMRRGNPWREWPLLMLAFALGLTPYLYTAWADAHAIGLDYLRYIDPVLFPATGVPDSTFDTPAQRVGWLILGRNVLPGSHMVMHLRDLARSLYLGVPLAVLFELGPVATLLLIPGVRRGLERRRDEAIRTPLMVLLSGLLAAQVVVGPLFSIFMLYSFAQLALFVALGLEWACDRFVPIARAQAGRALLVPALAVLAMVPAHALRLYANAHPIPPGHWQALEEDRTRPLRLIWRFRDPYAFRHFGEAAMQSLPESCLVVGQWTELPILNYFRFVLHRRPDLTLHEYSYPRYLVRARAWQETHDLHSHPIVFVGMPPETRRHLTAAESLDVSPGYRIYIIHSPLRDLPTWKGGQLVP